MEQQDHWLLTVTGTVWRVGEGRKTPAFVGATVRLRIFSISAKVVFIVQAAWHFLHVASTMVNGQAFTILTRQPTTF